MARLRARSVCLRVSPSGPRLPRSTPAPAGPTDPRWQVRRTLGSHRPPGRGAPPGNLCTRRHSSRHGRSLTGGHGWTWRLALMLEAVPGPGAKIDLQASTVWTGFGQRGIRTRPVALRPRHAAEEGGARPGVFLHHITTAHRAWHADRPQQCPCFLVCRVLAAGEEATRAAVLDHHRMPLRAVLPARLARR